MQVIDLRGVTVLVTGAGGGIGQGIARYLRECGAHLALHARSPSQVSADLANESGGISLAGDIRDETACIAMVSDAVKHFGHLDVLINNAAIQPVTPLAEMTSEQWYDVIDTNLTGTFLMTQAAAAVMGEGGSIIQIASVEASLPAVGHAHYAAAKAGVKMYARAAALEYGPRGIRVNSVSPGLIDTGGLAQSWRHGYNSWNSRVPLGRVGSSTDVATACAFLASPLSQWISGHDLVVDGGMSAVPAW